LYDITEIRVDCGPSAAETVRPAKTTRARAQRMPLKQIIFYISRNRSMGLR
jgi:hypothetical protein